MTAERQPMPNMHTPSEQGFQRLLLREYKDQSQPGDGLKRFGVNLALFTGSTAVDLLESHAVDKFIRHNKKLDAKLSAHEALKDENVKDLNTVPEEVKNSEWYATMLAKATKQLAKDETLDLDNVKDEVHKMAKKELGIKRGLEFMEEWGTDSLYAGMANAWVRLMTGVEGAKYVSETSAFIADWFIVWSQVQNDNAVYPKKYRFEGKKTVPQRGWKGIKLAYEAADFVNPVNVEAAFRMIEEIPVFGDGILWLHRKADQFLETPFMQKANTLASKGALGLHIGKNVETL